MSSKFLKQVEIMVWARFLSTNNNKDIKTVLIELSIIRHSPRPFFYVYSLSKHMIHINHFTIPDLLFVNWSP